eukprot:508025_1
MSSTQILWTTKQITKLFERLGYELFMSYLLNGYIIRYKNKHNNEQIYVPKDLCKLIALYTPIINDLITSMIELVGKLQHQVDTLAETLVRKSQSLLDALQLSDSLTVEQEPYTWTVNETARWIKRLGNRFEQIAYIFISFGVNGQDLLHLDQKQLKSMKITNVFLVSKLLRKISELKQE